jgi:hypothetical protein
VNVRVKEGVNVGASLTVGVVRVEEGASAIAIKPMQ